ncbi:metallophosphoesterase [Hyphobacterium sp. CCMP332]|nr:metallophosphoesterase [Hyphobacterium sp. CCMP332]
MSKQFPKSIALEYNVHGKDWIITDIHACFNTLRRLLKKIELSKKDRLFLLGDLVNKGPRSSETLDYLIDLEKQGFIIFKVMGNHDLIWLDLLQGKIQADDIKIMNQQNLKPAQVKNEEYIDFLRRSYYYILLSDNYLVHAGFNFQSDSPFEEYVDMTNIREWELDDRYLEGKRVIHGHIAHPFVKIFEAVEKKAQRIPLDNGCVYIGERPGTGRLLALEAKSFELISQKNTDQNPNSIFDEF